MKDILEPETISQETPGQILKRARERGQISINEVAQRLLLSKKVITAIEEDDYSKIPAQVYAEGYLKAYAQFLKIPANPIIESFRSLNVYSRSEDKVTTTIQEPAKTNILQEILNLLKKEPYRNYVVIGAFALLILGTIIFSISRHFFSKNTEVINVPNTSDQTAANNGIISDNQIPVTTTTAPSEEATTPDSGTPKQKNIPQKTGKQNTKNVPLMLDNTPPEIKTSNNNEPKLILTPPKGSSTPN